MSARWTIVLACLALAGAAAQEPDAGIQPLLTAGDASYMHGDYDAARQSFEKAWELVRIAAATDPARYDVLKKLTHVSAASGDLAAGDRYLQMAILWRESTLGPDDPKLSGDLLEAVALCRGLKDFDRALLLLRRVLALDTAATGPDSKPVADDYSRMAQIYMDQKMMDSAVGPLNLALSIRTRLAGPMDPVLVPDLDRLAEAYIAVRQYDNAEYIYRRALVIRESVYGRVHADLIATVDGLAYSCFGQQKYDEAEPLYRRLIDLWVFSVGNNHPMVAIALDKVAIFYTEQKKFDQAKEAVDRANAIRARSLATGLEVEANWQWEQGKAVPTKALLERALRSVEPPDAVYDDLHKEIVAMLDGLRRELAKPETPKTAEKKR
jgi:tetratricopeptide (TPR) repeat protein